MLQNAVSHRCVCVKLNTKGWGVSHHFLGSANLPQKVSYDMGYRSHSITISHDMGPLSAVTLILKINWNNQWESVFVIRNPGNIPLSLWGVVRGLWGSKKNANKQNTQKAIWWSVRLGLKGGKRPPPPRFQPY